MATPDDHPRGDVAPPQADDRLAGGGRKPRHRKAARGEGERPAGRAGWMVRLRGGKPGTQGLLALGGAGAILLLVIGGVWSWTVGRHPQGVPVIGPPPYPVKDRPADPGGMMIMGDDTTKSDVTGRGAVHLAPPPEQPDASLLAGRMTPHRGDEGTTSPADGHAEEVRAARSSAGGNDAGAGHASSGDGNAEKASHDVTGHGVKGHDVAGHDDAGHGKDGQAGNESRHAASTRDHAAGADGKAHGVEPRLPLPHQAPLAPPLSAGEVRREQRGKDGLTGARAGNAQPQAQAGEAGHYEVQLAALQNEEQARQEWVHLRHRLPELLGGHEPVLRTVERGGKSFVRLRVGGFADRAAARQLCVQLHAQAQACSVAAN